MEAATSTIPVVFSMGANPVKLGLVASLNRPGGNLTGVTGLNNELEPKRLELLHELVPTATIIALLNNPISPTAEAHARDLQAAARIIGLQLHALNASTEHDIDTAFATLVQLRAGGLVITSNNFFNGRSEQLAALALRYAVPAIHQGQFAAAGGLMSYGGSNTDSYRWSASTPGAFSRARSRATCRCSSPRKSSLCLTSRRPRGSASRCRSRCLPVPTRSSSSAQPIHTPCCRRSGQQMALWSSGDFLVLRVLLPSSGST
jgi:putative ABC transport system substrate-binding protein